VSFTGRTYDDIVADLLTTLTRGVAGERHAVVSEGTGRDAVVADIILDRRPVRRVSRVSGHMAVPGADEPKPVEFTPADYQLIGEPDDPDDRHTLRFLRTAARRPAAGTDVIVSYYPRTTDPTVLTDVQPGSVVRTLLEVVAREVAVLYAQLDGAYDSAFVDTAGGSSLDRVVALLGLHRYRAGRPVGSVRFGRRAGQAGNVTIPAGTPITDGLDKIRYETTETRTMLSGESTAEVRVRGSTDTTPVVEPATLTVIQRSIAGVETVTNDHATTTSNEDETDTELRSRARAALLAASHGTLAAIEYGLLQLPDVRSVRIDEAPHGVPGELRVAVDLAQGDGATIPDAVLQRIEELRPAGVRVIAEAAGSLVAAARVRLVLAGAGLPAGDVTALRRAVATAVVAAVGRTSIGEPVRAGRLVAAILADERIADAAIALGERGAAPGATGADLDPGPNRGVRLSLDDVTFEAESAARPAAAASVPAPAEVRARIRATSVGGTPAGSLQALLTDRLTAYLAAIRPGTVITAGTLLDALRDESAYQVDPLGLEVTVTAGDQFARVAQGGDSFTFGGGRLVVASLAVVE
jgi:hypothetical protein